MDMTAVADGFRGSPGEFLAECTAVRQDWQRYWQRHGMPGAPDGT